MSYMKRFVEEVMVEMGKDTPDDEVMAETQRRLDWKKPRATFEKEAKFWISYDVAASGEANFNSSRVYNLGHSMKCKWTAFINDLAAHGEPGHWRVVEDSDTRKAVGYDDKFIKMTVFQLVSISALSEFPPRGGDGEYKSIGECIQDGTHLTDCDDDGYCNYCGEQDDGQG
jgi:hypothetical protein